MNLSEFILNNIELILEEWENFAKTLFKAVQSKKTLRDHLKAMLLEIAQDLQQEQSSSEQIAKSKGQQPQDNNDDNDDNETAGEEHGVARMEEGFTINELFAEYRALRASVTKLWGYTKNTINLSDVNDIIRFNEAIDQSLSESINSYALSKEKQTRDFVTMLSSSPDLIYIIDINGVLLYVNQAISDLYHKPAQELIGQIIYDLEKNLKSEEQARIQLVLETGKPCRGDRIFIAPSGKKYFFEYIYTPIFDEQGKIDAIAGNSRDITERKIAEEKISHLANTDSLTELPNRRLFRDRLAQAIKQMKREHNSFALLSIDLDSFKNVNDRLGHEIGDFLLQEASTRITACVRDIDTVARMGGDEFTVILTNINDLEHIGIVSEKILFELRKLFQIKRHRIELSGSIGIALCPQDGTRAGSLLRNADKAMYAAKKAGGNQCRFYCEELRSPASSHRLTPDFFTRN